MARSRSPSTSSASSATRSCTSSTWPATPNVKIVERGTGSNLDEYSPQADPVARRRQRRRRRRRHRGGPAGRVQGQPAELRQPARPRRGRPEGQLPGLEVERRASPPTASSSSASAPTSAAWPCATARTCSPRPACPPSATRSRSSGRPGTDYIAIGEQFKAQGTGAVASSTRRPTPQHDPDAVRRQHDRLHLLRHRRQPRHRQQPGGQAGLGHSPWTIIDAGLSAKLQAVVRRSGTPASRTRKFATIACPAWMTGVIKGNAGRRAQGQVGHRHRSPATAATGAARSSPCRSRASTRTRRSSWPSS